MSTLTEGQPDLEQAVEAFYRNKDYRRANSVEKCHNFIEACTDLQLLMPQFTEEGLSTSRVAYRVEAIAELQRKAERWLETVGRKLQGKGARYAQTNMLQEWGKSGRYGDRRHYGPTTSGRR